MLDMANKLVEAGISTLPVPKTGTFSDGTLATKEAWNYCRALCQHREIKPPTLGTFKWHLQEGKHLQGRLACNPFGGSPKEIHSIRPESVAAFVDALAEGGEKMHVVTERQRDGSVMRRRAPGAPEKPEKPEKPRPTRELTSRRALEYIQNKVGRRCELNSTTFGFYLAYDVIPSRWEGKQRMVDQEDLDAFLDLAPTGVQANHMQYEVASTLAPGQLSMKDAYAYYANVDPNPVTLNTFRSLVAAGILTAIRTANAPKAPVVGFEKGEVDAFLARRQRIMEKNREAPATKGFLTRKEREKTPVPPAVSSAIEDALDAAEQKTGVRLGGPRQTPSPKPPEPPEKTKATKAPKKQAAQPDGRWAPIKDAYAYYLEKAPKPFTESWFRDKCYRTDLFGKRVLKDERPNNPTGKKYLIDLDTVDAYLAGERKPRPKPKPGSQKAWPVEKAFHKFRELVPPGLSLLQFKRLVNGGLIKSVTRNTVVHVRHDAVREYFDGLVDLDTDKSLQMGGAYDYYCSRCTDPVAKAHFSRWVAGGEIEGAERNDDGLWTITMAAIDTFIDKFPTGRMRPNRNSRASVGVTSPKKGGRKLAQAVQRARAETADLTSAGKVSVSMASYSSPAAMKKAIDLLTSQGFEVDVKP